MGERLKNKVAIITGGASGIGRETAMRFAAEGARVTVADRNHDMGEETARLVTEQGGESQFVPVDVSKVDQVQDMVKRTEERFGGVNVLVNAAAVLIRTPPLAAALGLDHVDEPEGALLLLQVRDSCDASQRRRVDSQHHLASRTAGLRDVPSVCR